MVINKQIRNKYYFSQKIDNKESLRCLKMYCLSDQIVIRKDIK